MKISGSCFFLHMGFVLPCLHLSGGWWEMAAPTPELPRTKLRGQGASIPIPNAQERGNLIGLAWVRCLLLVQSSVASGRGLGLRLQNGS